MKRTQEFAETAPKGRYSYGDNLVLVVSGINGRSWIAKIQRNNVRRDYGVGPVSSVTLEEARKIARDYRRMLNEGKDPTKKGGTARP
jgi:hypothetical protein